MDLNNLLRANMIIGMLQDNEVMSRALREMYIGRAPWYQRPFLRIKFAWKFRRAWKERLKQNLKRLEEINSVEEAEPQAEVEIVASPNAN